MNASKWRLVVGLRELTRHRKRLAFLGWANHRKVNALGEMKDEALLVTCDMCMPLVLRLGRPQCTFVSGGSLLLLL